MDKPEKKPRKQKQPKKKDTTDEIKDIEFTETQEMLETTEKPEPKKRGVKKGARMVEYRKNDFRYTNTKVPVERYKELLEIEKKYKMLCNDIAINNISK